MKNDSTKKIRFGMIGYGTVGQGVYKLWHRAQKKAHEDFGVEIVISKIAVSKLDKTRKVHAPTHLLTDDPWKIVNDPEIDVLIELAGGIHPAHEWINTFLKSNKPVITANKALLCDWGKEIFELANRHHTNVFFEASVCGGIPIIKMIREGFVANKIHSINGIVNASTNYILSQMEKRQLPYDTVIEEVRKLGILETDESLDLDGLDAAHKAVILGFLISSVWIKREKMHIEGIRNVTLEDIQKANNEGSSIRLIANVQYDEKNHKLSLSVAPKYVPFSDPLSKVDGFYNAVLIESDLLGKTFIKGIGGGQDSTANGVLSNVIDVVRFCQSTRN